jgi:hypothetical protein
MQLPNFAREGRYLLRYHQTHEEVPFGARFAQVFRPGSHLIMPLVVSYDDQLADICPGCRSPSNMIGDSTLRCACGTVYTRLSRCQNKILMLPAHRKPLHQLNEQDTPAAQQLHGFSSTADTSTHAQQVPTTTKPQFEVVKNIKNVDFSAPRMIIVLDWLGFMYMIPWRMVRTAEKLQFVLRRFIAGGSILDWTRDYVTCIIDDEKNEVTPANWESTAHPGISIALRPWNNADHTALRQTLMLRIQDVLSTSTRSLQKCELGDAVEEVCLLVGATSSQSEIRTLVEDAVASKWHKGFKRRHTPPGRVTQTETTSGSVCLICDQDYTTSLDLAKHTRCHMTVLRCADVCDTCDEQSSPHFAEEDVSQRHKGSQSRPTVNSALVDDVKKIGPPSGSWVCCTCRQTNNPRSCPDRCPMDGHYRCGRCYVYPRPEPQPRPTQPRRRR